MAVPREKSAAGQRRIPLRADACKVALAERRAERYRRSMRFSRGCLLPSNVRGILLPVLTALAACFSLPASAADSAFVEYPVKPIRILVAASPGTADDFFARTL
ncbi:MAG TPA: hypothetical protein VFZ51_01925, partial [Woeseiaceae bacterium]